MSSEYKRNHYVPVWYQKRFVSSEEPDCALYRLDKTPGTFRDGRGILHSREAVRKLGPKYIFCEDDLYTQRFGATESHAIEQQFFGELDRRGKSAVELISKLPEIVNLQMALPILLHYMSAQKLRTPKGLDDLAKNTQASHKTTLLADMVRMSGIFAAIWSECIWEVVDASESPTKFILSDHPITVYNRFRGPKKCDREGESDIRQIATHTIFPLSLDKALILTNLSWVRNPHQDGNIYRPNPDLFRNTILDFHNLKFDRHLAEEEVRQINFIVKSRALRFIAAGKEEWLYPDDYISKSDWNTFGQGYLLMPDPRNVTYTTRIIIGSKDGRTTQVDPYGRHPWQKGYNLTDEPEEDFVHLELFKKEFTELFGPDRRDKDFLQEVMNLNQSKKK